MTAPAAPATLAPDTPAGAPTPARPSHHHTAVLGGLAVLVMLWCSAGIGVPATHHARVAADEPQYVLSAISLAEDGDLDIADELADERWRSFHRADLPLQTRVLDGGRQLSPHDPLLPVLLAVPVALGGWVGAKLALAAMAGLLAAAIAWLAHVRAGVPFTLAVAGAAVFAMSPPLAVYATQVYPEIPAALVVALGLAVVTGPMQGRSPWALAIVVTVLPWLSVKFVPVAVALAVVGGARMLRRGERAALARLALVLAASGVAYVALHRLLYGGWTVYAAGDHFFDGEATVMGHHPNLAGRSRRLAGLLVDREFGLVPWQPAFLVAVPAVGAVLRAGLQRSRRVHHLAPALGATLVAGWLVASFAALTMHGWWWPGRQVVVVVPVLVVAALWWAASTPGRARVLLAAGGLGVATFAWLVVEGTAGTATWVVDFMDTGNPLYRLWRLVLPDERSSAAAHVARHAGWVTVLVGLVAYGWRHVPGLHPDRPG